MTQKLKVINFFAGPGAGKSTMRAGTFFHMKLLNMKVDEAPEFAKDAFYEGRMNIFEYQEYVFAEQAKRLAALEGKVEWAVTDSPLMLTIWYARQRPSPINKELEALVMASHSRYENFNLYLSRTKEYQKYGRGQEREEAVKIDLGVLDLLDSSGEDYRIIPYGESTPRAVINYVLGIHDAFRGKDIGLVASVRPGSGDCRGNH